MAKAKKQVKSAPDSLLKLPTRIVGLDEHPFLVGDGGISDLPIASRVLVGLDLRSIKKC